MRTNNQHIAVISATGYDGYQAVWVLQPGWRFNQFVFADFLQNKIVILLTVYNGRNARSAVMLGNKLLWEYQLALWRKFLICLISCNLFSLLIFVDSHAVHHVAEVADIVYGAGALVRSLPSFSPDLNPIERSYHQAKEFIRESDIAFCCRFQPCMFILYAFRQILSAKLWSIL